MNWYTECPLCYIKNYFEHFCSTQNFYAEIWFEDNSREFLKFAL